MSGRKRHVLCRCTSRIDGALIVGRAWLLCVLIVSLACCARYDVPSSDLDHQGRSATILIPGYYGSRLVQPADGKLIWISTAQALFGNQPLTLPIAGLGFQTRSI